MLIGQSPCGKLESTLVFGKVYNSVALSRRSLVHPILEN